MIIFHWKLCSFKKMQEEETNCFHINDYFVSIKHCLLFLKKARIFKEAEMKLPYLTSYYDTS